MKEDASDIPNKNNLHPHKPTVPVHVNMLGHLRVYNPCIFEMPKFLQIAAPGRAFLQERNKKDKIGASYFVYRDGLAVTGTTRSIYTQQGDSHARPDFEDGVGNRNPSNNGGSDCARHTARVSPAKVTD
jgi:hypothetical protein